MRNLIAASALALAAAAPSIASAEGLTYSAGATVASKYISGSASVYTKGAAFQPWLEAEYNGAYFGYWGSNVDPELNTTEAGDRDSWEHDVYVGYRNSFNGINYDATYTRFYMNKSGNAGDEVSLAVNYDFTEQFNLGAKIMVDPSDYRRSGNGRLIAKYKLDDKIAFKATAGKVSHGHEYYTLGASYALNDEYAVSLTQIKKSGVEAQRTVLALDYAFSFK